MALNGLRLLEAAGRSTGGSSVVKRALLERETAGATFTDKGWGGDANAPPSNEVVIRPEATKVG